MEEEKKKNKINASLFGVDLSIDVDEVLDNFDKYEERRNEKKIKKMKNKLEIKKLKRNFNNE